MTIFYRPGDSDEPRGEAGLAHLRRTLNLERRQDDHGFDSYLLGVRLEAIRDRLHLEARFSKRRGDARTAALVADLTHGIEQAIGNHRRLQDQSQYGPRVGDTPSPGEAGEGSVGARATRRNQ